MENISETYKNFFFESSYINYKLINGQQLNENEKRKYNIIKHLITAYYKCVNIHDNKNCVNTLFKDAASSESNITDDEEGDKLVLNTTNKIIDEQNKIINNKWVNYSKLNIIDDLEGNNLVLNTINTDSDEQIPYQYYNNNNAQNDKAIKKNNLIRDFKCALY